MTNRNSTQTASTIRYLLVLNELDQSDTGTRSIDIAERLGVTKPSVHTMMKALRKKDYITKEKYEAVHLTDAGRSLAKRYTECFTYLYRQMQKTLHLSDVDCQNAACAVLSETPEGELEGLAERLKSDPCCWCSRDCKR